MAISRHAADHVDELTDLERERLLKSIRNSKTFIRAYQDLEFLSRDELRPLRLQLELLKPEMALAEHTIHSTIVVFGSARVESPERAAKQVKDLERAVKSNPKDKTLHLKLRIAKHLLTRTKYYNEARKFAAIVTRAAQADTKREFVIITGGGPGIMEAANRGAFDAGGKSIGLTITLPKEQDPNPYITPELCFKFHYFAIRKMHFLLRCRALVAFPGGFGTMDELFETLTLVQTGKMKPLPIILFGKEFWTRAINFSYLAEEGMITPQDLRLMLYVDTAEEAWEHIQQYWRHNGLYA